MLHLAPLALALTVLVSHPDADWPGNPRGSAVQDRGEPRPPTEDPPRDLERLDGFLPLWWDSRQGRLHLEIQRFGEEFLWLTGLRTGLGSNPVGLDRGQLGTTRLVHFRRVGSKVLLIERNPAFRALDADPAQVLAVAESFATSVLWGFEIEHEGPAGVRVDATAFLLSDAHGIGARLSATEQGSYAIDTSRSALLREWTRAFPRNSEVETLLTFTTSGSPGALVRGVSANARALTFHVHHSFVARPEPGFAPRPLDPRVGNLHTQVYDYSSAYTAPIEQRWVLRHRLLKKDSSAAVSEVIEPIVYWLDPGIPEPLRRAVFEGASWWSEALLAAGFRNAFEVRMLPPEADPMDARYNVIHWTHRSSRGWSYGDSVVDPLSGEIVKGNVVLGSLRVRQDWLIASGLVGAVSGDPASREAARELPLARLRQLAAHEVGHAIGLDHNFAASTDANASVMDYPAPRVEIVDGRLDLSRAYSRGVGRYDLWAIRYAYSQFAPDRDEAAELARIVDEGLGAGLHFVQDDDARSLGSAHPRGSLWDNGSDAVAELRHALAVRRIALASFGVDQLPAGAPFSTLEARLLPLFLHHRYQIEAAAKLVGGVDFRYAVKGEDARGPLAPARAVVDAGRQREALTALVGALDLEVLAVPRRLLSELVPRAYGHGAGAAEHFEGRSAPLFDPLGAAESAAGIVLDALLEPRRLARLESLHAEQETNPGAGEVLDALCATIAIGPGERDGYLGAIGRRLATVLVERLIRVASDEAQAPEVRAEVAARLRRIAAEARGTPGTGADIAHRRALRDGIERFLARPAPGEGLPPRRPPPPGPPIGAAPWPACGAGTISSELSGATDS